MDKDRLVLVWMLFLLATNTAVLLTLLRERITFRLIRDGIVAFLPPGYDSQRLSYPFLFDRLAPPSWRAALATYEQLESANAQRKRWRQFQKIRIGLMLAEVAGIFLFAVWMALG